MDSIQSAPATFAVLVLLAFGAPAPAYTQTKDMSLMEHGGGHGQMMGMGPMDRMYKKQAQYRAGLTIAETDEQFKKRKKMMPMEMDKKKPANRR